MTIDWPLCVLLAGAITACGGARRTPTRFPEPPGVLPPRGADILCPEGVRLEGWIPPPDWRHAYLPGEQASYHTPYGQGVITLCSFTRQVLESQERAAREGEDIPYLLGIQERDTRLVELQAEAKAQKDADARAQAQAADLQAAAALADAKARAYAEANLARVAGVRLCELQEEEDSWRGDIRDEKRAAAVSGYEDKASLHRAGVAIVGIGDARAELVRRVRAATKRAPSCDAFAAAAYACADESAAAACTEEQRLARSAVPHALRFLAERSSTP